MLIMHRGFYISMAHCPHDGSQIPGSHKNPSAVIMAGTIKNQFSRKRGLLPCFSKQAIDGAQVTRSRSVGRKHPPFRSCAAAPTQNFENTTAHWDKSSAFGSLAVRYKNHAILPIEILDTRAVELSLVSHARVAHQNDNVAEKVTSSFQTLAGGSSRE